MLTILLKNRARRCWQRYVLREHGTRLSDTVLTVKKYRDIRKGASVVGVSSLSVE